MSTRYWIFKQNLIGEIWCKSLSPTNFYWLCRFSNSLKMEMQHPKINRVFEAKTFLCKITISSHWYVMLLWRIWALKLHKFTEFTMFSPWNGVLHTKKLISKIDKLKQNKNKIFLILLIFYHVNFPRHEIYNKQKSCDHKIFIAFLIGNFSQNWRCGAKSCGTKWNI